jgi:hypothetical protein
MHNVRGEQGCMWGDANGSDFLARNKVQLQYIRLTSAKDLCKVVLGTVTPPIGRSACSAAPTRHKP